MTYAPSLGGSTTGPTVRRHPPGGMRGFDLAGSTAHAALGSPTGSRSRTAARAVTPDRHTGAMPDACAATVLPSAAAATAAAPGALYVVAHADDSLLFQSPDLLKDICSGGPVRTVVVSAGDNGKAEAYWSGREAGIRAAYAHMAGAKNVWSSWPVTVTGRTIAHATLMGRPNVVINFLRLPDGGYPDGNGTSRYQNQSLMKLWQGSIADITAVDSSNNFTKSTLTQTLTAFMELAGPGRISTQDYVGSFGDGDHADHYATAYLTVAAHESYPAAHRLVGYANYATTKMVANVTGEDLSAKSAAFYAYTPFDADVCQSPAACSSHPEGAWLARQYVVDTKSASDVHADLLEGRTE